MELTFSAVRCWPDIVGATFPNARQWLVWVPVALEHVEPLSYCWVMCLCSSFILRVQSVHNNLSYLTSSTDLLYFFGSLFASNLRLTLSVPVKCCGFVNIQQIKEA